MENHNHFLVKLNNLEVAGKGAISGPSNWDQKPLLEIETSIDEIIEKVASGLVHPKHEDAIGQWWFLVGSPGNGKSAAVGKLVRTLRESHSSSFHEPKEGSKKGREITELGSNEIPYVVELYNKEFQYPSALFAQDASVVPDPYLNDPDPGDSLVHLLKTAASKGQSVVVCANRGVVERALQKHKSDSKERWYIALSAVQKNEIPNEPIIFNDGEKKSGVFKSVTVEITTLDEKSIIDDGSFEKLIKKATSDENWQECTGCSSADLCPFKSNREWLKSQDGLVKFADVMRTAELMSEQPIVFREAVAFISLMLTGSSRDYKDTDPCGWVHKQVNDDAIFSLLARRIYMLLFKSDSPMGLKLHNEDREQQIKIIRKSKSFLDSQNARALEHLKDSITTDVGLTRFLSSQGIFRELDPVKENQGKMLETKWNITTGDTESTIYKEPLVTEIERRCFNIWNNCENIIEKLGVTPSDERSIYYRELRRWITSVTYRLGFFAEGNILFHKELKEYQNVLKIPSEPKVRTKDQQDMVRKIQTDFKKFVFNDEDIKIQISEVLTVYGGGIGDKLAPKLDLNASRKARLIMSLANNVTLELSPRSYAWLRRKSETHLSEKTFPPAIRQVARDMQLKAATAVNYAFEERLSIKIKHSPEDIFLVREDDQLHLSKPSA